MIAVLVFSFPASAANPILKPYSQTCLTENLLDQFETALISQDMQALGWLTEHGCTISDKPLKVTVLNLSSWGGKAHVRVYRGKHAVEVWTPRDQLEGYEAAQ
jgi:hypothetical protein